MTYIIILGLCTCNISIFNKRKVYSINIAFKSIQKNDVNSSQHPKISRFTSGLRQFLFCVPLSSTTYLCKSAKIPFFFHYHCRNAKGCVLKEHIYSQEKRIKLHVHRILFLKNSFLLCIVSYTLCILFTFFHSNITYMELASPNESMTFIILQNPIH